MDFDKMRENLMMQKLAQVIGMSSKEASQAGINVLIEAKQDVKNKVDDDFINKIYSQAIDATISAASVAIPKYLEICFNGGDPVEIDLMGTMDMVMEAGIKRIENFMEHEVEN